MACRELFGLGFFLGSLLGLWGIIISDIIKNKERSLNQNTLKKR